jgi:hypothetical protein
MRRGLKSNRPKFSKAINIENMVGTPGKTVTPSRSIASRILTGKLNDRCKIIRALFINAMRI